jgi:hypothetical protein
MYSPLLRKEQVLKADDRRKQPRKNNETLVQSLFLRVWRTLPMIEVTPGSPFLCSVWRRESAESFLDQYFKEGKDREEEWTIITAWMTRGRKESLG